MTQKPVIHADPEGSSQWAVRVSQYVSGVSQSLVAAMICGVAGASVLGWWAATTREGLISGLVVGAIVFACILGAWNSAGQIAERHLRTHQVQPPWTPERSEQQIQTWLLAHQFKIHLAPSAEVYFRIGVTDHLGMNFTIFHERTSSWITIAASITADVGTLDFEVLSSRTSGFRQELSMRLFQMGVEFVVLDEAGKPQILALHRMMLDETVTAIDFFMATMLVRRAIGLVNAATHAAVLQMRQNSLPGLKK